MDELSSMSPTERVTLMKSAQVGGSEAGNNFLAYVIAKGLGPTMCVQATLDLADDYSKQRLDPMIRDTPILREKLGERTGTNRRNQLRYKEAPGATVILRGGETAKGLRSAPIRNLFLDEVDAYPTDIDGEGDPISLAIKRTDTYDRRKIFMVSTPTIEGSSRIEEEFLTTDQRYYFVPCPECGEYQKLIWKQVVFDRDDEGALISGSTRYACAHCGSMLEERQKKGMLANGEWRPTAKARIEHSKGYHISALYSPWCPWERVAQEFLAAGRIPHKLKTWTNTFLGESFADQGDAPDWMKLWARREPYDKDELPEGVRVLTAGVDCQQDRLEMEIVGWGERLISWSIEYVVLEGDTAKKAVWSKLEAYLKKTWKHANGGELGIARMAIDAGDGSYSGPAVYSWARDKAGQVLPVRGRAQADRFLYNPKDSYERKKGSRGRKLGLFWPVGVSLIKDELYSSLRTTEPGDGERVPDLYCHFPRDREQDYFKMLTSERKVVKPNSKGIPVGSWKLGPNVRNEALDCRVYARAAAFRHGIDRFRPDHWEAARLDTLPGDAQTKRTTSKAPKRKKRRSNFLKGGRSKWLDGPKSSTRS
jgi:phage terminase large subunit GpA-like protein